VKNVPDWQTLLFVPVGAERHLASALRHRPDAIVLDLEDAIASDAKPGARRQLAAAQARVAEAGIGCVVRVNSPLAVMVEDIAAADLKHLDGLIVPKCESARPLENAAELIGPGPGLIALIETPAAVTNLHEIASVPGVVGLMLGSEDYSAALGVDPNGGALDFLAAAIGIACAPRDLLSIGFPGSLANFSDLDRYGSQIERGRHLGMRAVAAIHPAQLPVIRERLAPTASEMAWANRVLEAAGEIEGRAHAVTAREGGMIDAPVIARARRIKGASERFRFADRQDASRPK
jgi:citrate lyase subunit beta/citryl-CoA lyase